MPHQALQDDSKTASSEPIGISGTPFFRDETVRLAQLYGHAESMRLPLPPPRKPDNVGDVTTFWCHNFRTETDYQIQATCKRVGVNCYIYVENGQTMADSTLDEIMQEFDVTIYPTDRNTFGSEWKPGIDNDDKITVLILDIRDNYAVTNLYVAGYFYSGDEYTQSVVPHSNEREMFYMDLNPGTPGSQGFFGTLAHEFQHMIHWHQDADELTWIDEGCADYAMYVCGYGHPTGHVNAFLNNHDKNLTAWNGNLEDYGASYLFILYLAEHYGGNTFIHDLVAEDQNNIDGINKTLEADGHTERFIDIFKDWTVANYLDNNSVNSKYEYSSIDFSMKPLDYEGSFSGGTLKIGGSTTAPSPVNEWAANYISIDLHVSSLKTKFIGDILSAFDVFVIPSSLNGYSVEAISLNVLKDGERIEPEPGQLLKIVYIAVRNSDWIGNGQYEFNLEGKSGKRVLFDDIHDADFDELSGNYSKLKTALEGEGFAVHEFDSGLLTENLLTQYDVLILPDIELELSVSETHAMASYLNNGGRILVIGEWALAHAPVSASQLTQVMGIKFQNTLIHDPDNYYMYDEWPIIHNLNSSHPICGGVTEFAMYAGSSLSITEKAVALAWGDENTQAETISFTRSTGDFIDTGFSEYRSSLEGSAGDIVTLACSTFAVSGGEARLVCISDSDLWKNQGDEWIDYDPIQHYDNKRLLTNIIKWLAAPVSKKKANTVFGAVSQGSTSKSIFEVNEGGFLEFVLEWPGSDLDLHLYDPTGRHVGMNYNIGEVEIEIPGILYSGPLSEPEWIRVPVTRDMLGSWTIEVYGAQVDLPAEFYSVTIQHLQAKSSIFGENPVDYNKQICTVSHNNLEKARELFTEPQSFLEIAR